MTMNRKHLDYMKAIRQFELTVAVPFFRPQSRLLEIGGGTGWQAQRLSELKFDVESIDLDSSNYSHERVWPVQNYDGYTIPFADQSFDAVFSSNLLEHIPHVETYQQEIFRVLKKDGVVVHILPSTTWRLYALISHFPLLVEEFFLSARTQRGKSSIDHSESTDAPRKDSKTPAAIRALKRLIPPRHGELGNSLSELYYFSRHRWLRLFRRCGWHVENVLPTRLFHAPVLTRHGLPGIDIAQAASYVLGSSCLVYVLRPKVASANIV